MTRSNINKRLDIAVARAAEAYPNLTRRHVSPQSVRHPTAMHMLQSGVAVSVMALWAPKRFDARSAATVVARVATVARRNGYH
jgi:site-specific recombinase XerC